MDSGGIQTVTVMLGLMAVMSAMAAVLVRDRFTAFHAAPVPAAPVTDDSPLLWTREGLIDFFQLNDSMSAETFHKFCGLLPETAAAPVQSIPAAKPRIRVKATAAAPTAAAPVEKPRVRVKAGSRHIDTAAAPVVSDWDRIIQELKDTAAAMAQNTAVQAPEEDSATYLAETSQTLSHGRHTAVQTVRHGYYWRDHAAGLLALFLILIIASTNTAAGLCFRAAVSVIPLWAGWISEETYMSFATSYLLKLI